MSAASNCVQTNHNTLRLYARRGLISPHPNASRLSPRLSPRLSLLILDSQCPSLSIGGSLPRWRPPVGDRRAGAAAYSQLASSLRGKLRVTRRCPAALRMRSAPRRRGHLRGRSHSESAVDDCATPDLDRPRAVGTLGRGRTRWRLRARRSALAVGLCDRARSRIV